tara:strand:+ start:3601 stop:3858 length:258 start_codon:yes stop_codon:yes gene_type:complete
MIYDLEKKYQGAMPEYSQAAQDKYEQAIKDWKRQFQNNEQLIIRVSEEQKEKMLAYCTQKKITMSSFIRCLIDIALTEIEAENDD